MNYVIIGNSAAAVGCVEGIRQTDRSGSITVISREPHHVYSRPLISYLMLGKADAEKLRYRPLDFYEKMDVTPLLGREAVRIVTRNKQVLLAGGEQIAYDKLLIAAGSQPLVPPMSGLDTVRQQCTFMSLADAEKLAAMPLSTSRVLIIGAGLIGLKCAEGISKQAKKITVVDLADRVLPSVLDPEAAALIRQHLEAHGLEFVLADSVAEFKGNKALLKSGRELDFDILVVAVGVRPNTQLAAEAGILVKRGIVTDLHCATSLADIYAAGDCAESHDISVGQDRVLALLPNAYMQGECAGINMAGGEKLFDIALPINAVGFFGLHMVTAGSYEGEAHSVAVENGYKKLITKDNRLKGFIIINDVARAGIYTSLIRKQVPLDTIDFDLILQRPQLMAFSQAERAVMLGGAKA